MILKYKGHVFIQIVGFGQTIYEAYRCETCGMVATKKRSAPKNKLYSGGTKVSSLLCCKELCIKDVIE